MVSAPFKDLAYFLVMARSGSLRADRGLCLHLNSLPDLRVGTARLDALSREGSYGIADADYRALETALFAQLKRDVIPVRSRTSGSSTATRPQSFGPWRSQSTGTARSRSLRPSPAESLLLPGSPFAILRQGIQSAFCRAATTFRAEIARPSTARRLSCIRAGRTWRRVRLAARDLARLGPGKKLHMVGYPTRRACRRICARAFMAGAATVRPLSISPADRVSPAAAFAAGWDACPPFSARPRWRDDISPEYDPTSILFPVNSPTSTPSRRFARGWRHWESPQCGTAAILAFSVGADATDHACRHSDVPLLAPECHELSVDLNRPGRRGSVSSGCSGIQGTADEAPPWLST